MILGLVLAVSTVSHADAQRDVARCAAISGDAQRLTCYDELAESMGVAEPASSASEVGRWNVEVEVSPIDDSRNVFLTVESESAIRNSIGRPVKPVLFIRCKENTTEVFIAWGVYLGLDSTRVLERLDKQDATTTAWNNSTDNKAVFRRGNKIDYVKTLMEHDKVLYQVTPYNESPVMASFDLRGLSEAVEPLRDSCGW
jgi:type VI secretion system protein VasI